MPPERISDNPHLQVQPDFTGPGFAVIRNVIAQAQQIENDAVVQQLTDAWIQEYQVKRAVWDGQVWQDEEAEAAAEQLRREQADVQRAEEERQAEAEHREAEKKPKILEVPPDSVVGAAPVDLPVQYATDKLVA